MQTKKLSRLLIGAGIATVSALTLAACTAGPSGTSSSSSTTKAGTAVPSSVVTSANNLIKKYSDKPAFVAPGASLDASSVKGKKILVIDMDQVAQQLVTINKGISAAAAKTGLTVSFFNGQDTPSTLQQGIAEGIAQKVDAIVLNGVPPALVPNSIAAANSAGIPVIADTTGQSEPSGIFGTSSVNFGLLGQLVAAGAISQENGNKVTAAVIQFTNPLSPEVTTGIKSLFTKCSGNCTIVKTDTIEPQNWPTQVPSSASALVKANPKLTTILAFDDTMGQFAAAGVKSSGSSSVKVIGAQGSGEGPFTVVKQGGAYVADPGQSSLWIGWGAVDQVLRALLKMPAGKDVTPPRYIDAAALDGATLSDPDSVYGNAYIAGFEKLWGLS